MINNYNQRNLTYSETGELDRITTTITGKKNWDLLVFKNSELVSVEDRGITWFRDQPIVINFPIVEDATYTVTRRAQVTDRFFFLVEENYNYTYYEDFFDSLTECTQDEAYYRETYKRQTIEQYINGRDTIQRQTEVMPNYSFADSIWERIKAFKVYGLLWRLKSSFLWRRNFDTDAVVEPADPSERDVTLINVINLNENELSLSQDVRTGWARLRDIWVGVRLISPTQVVLNSRFYDPLRITANLYNIVIQHGASVQVYFGNTVMECTANVMGEIIELNVDSTSEIVQGIEEDRTSRDLMIVVNGKAIPIAIKANDLTIQENAEDRVSVDIKQETVTDPNTGVTTTTTTPEVIEEDSKFDFIWDTDNDLDETIRKGSGRNSSAPFTSGSGILCRETSIPFGNLDHNNINNFSRSLLGDQVIPVYYEEDYFEFFMSQAKIGGHIRFSYITDSFDAGSLAALSVTSIYATIYTNIFPHLALVTRRPDGQARFFRLSELKKVRAGLYEFPTDSSKYFTGDSIDYGIIDLSNASIDIS